jgi:hypothetical protein
MLSQELIKELKSILEKDCKRKFDIKQVSEIANKLVNYFDLLAKIYHKKKYN